MGHLGIKENECSYQEHDRPLKEQLFNGKNNKANATTATQNYKTRQCLSYSRRCSSCRKAKMLNTYAEV